MTRLVTAPADAAAVHDHLVGMLDQRIRARRHQGRVIAPTDVLLPNGATLIAIVEGGAAGSRITVTDGGAALAQVADAGLDLDERPMARLRMAASRLGLEFEGSVLRTAPAPLEETEFEVIRLANAAREIAELALGAARKQERGRFRDRVQIELLRIFGHACVRQNAALRGFSEETLRFDWLVTLPGGRRLALDTPVPEHASIAAAIMRQVDLAAAHPAQTVQAIAYDDRDEWPSGAIRQLQLAKVPVIPAVALETGLLRLVAVP